MSASELKQTETAGSPPTLFRSLPASGKRQRSGLSKIVIVIVALFGTSVGIFIAYVWLFSRYSIRGTWIAQTESGVHIITIFKTGNEQYQLIEQIKPGPTPVTMWFYLQLKRQDDGSYQGEAEAYAAGIPGVPRSADDTPFARFPVTLRLEGGTLSCECPDMGAWKARRR